MNVIDQYHPHPAGATRLTTRTADTANALDDVFADVVGALRRRAWTVLVVMLMTLLAALAYIAMRQSTYRATTTLLVDPARSNLLASQQITALPFVDSGVVDSAAEIIRSDFVAQSVVNRFELTKDPDFNRASPLRAMLGPLVSLVSSGRRLSPDEVERGAVVAVQRKLDVSRIGLSYVIEINFTSSDPDKSARIANAFAETFLENQITAKFDAARQASIWLEQRTEELRTKVMDADRAVENYRTQNDLVESDGKLLMEQQLTELTTKLSASREKATDARVAAEQLAALIARGDFDSPAIEAPAESSISQLRGKLTELSREAKNIADRLGEKHRLAVDKRTEMLSVKYQLIDEVGKYHDSLVSTATSAAASVRQLEAETTKLTIRQLDLQQKRIRLRELERDATSLRQLYETFLGRLKELTQQETLPVQDARIVAPATRPSLPSNVSMTLVLAGALGFGLLAGATTALMRDRLDPSIRRIDEAEAVVGRRLLAIFEKIEGPSAKVAKTNGVRRWLIGRVNKAEAKTGKLLPVRAGILRHVAERPFSLFAEGFRHLRVALSLHGTESPRIIGVIATLSGEGKTTIASNLAHYYAMSGFRTMLIDCDLRNPSLSAQLCPDESRGVPDIVLDGVPWPDLVKVDPMTKLAMLPGKTKSLVGNPAELLTLPSFGDLLSEVSRKYEVVILDLAPIGSVFDARAVAGLVDMFVYVIAWGETHRDAVDRALANAPEVHDKIACVILNKADGKQLKTMRAGYGGFDRYHAAYSARDEG